MEPAWRPRGDPLEARRRPHGQPGPDVIYAFGDCELDGERLEVRRGGERRPVEPQVIDVLLHLVRHRDRIITRDELLARVGAMATSRTPPWTAA